MRLLQFYQNFSFSQNQLKTRIFVTESVSPLALSILVYLLTVSLRFIRLILLNYSLQRAVSTALDEGEPVAICRKFLILGISSQKYFLCYPVTVTLRLIYIDISALIFSLHLLVSHSLISNECCNLFFLVSNSHH